MRDSYKKSRRALGAHRGRAGNCPEPPGNPGFQDWGPQGSGVLRGLFAPVPGGPLESWGPSEGVTWTGNRNPRGGVLSPAPPQSWGPPGTGEGKRDKRDGRGDGDGRWDGGHGGLRETPRAPRGPLCSPREPWGSSGSAGSSWAPGGSHEGSRAGGSWAGGPLGPSHPGGPLGPRGPPVPSGGSRDPRAGA